MPAVNMFGRKWRVSSDFLPVFAGIGLVFHFFWVIFIIVWPFGVTKLRKCDNTTAGRHFLASTSLFFILYVLSFLQELLITLIGLRGKTRKLFHSAHKCTPPQRNWQGGKLQPYVQEPHWKQASGNS